MLFTLGQVRREQSEVSGMLELQSQIRLIVYGLFLVSILFRIQFDLLSFSPLPIVAATAVALLANLTVLYAVGRTNLEGRKWVWLFWVADILLITAITYYSGGIDSKSGFLYLLTCLSAMAISFRFAVGMGVLVFLAYALMLTLLYFGIAPPAETVVYTQGQLVLVNMSRAVVALVIVVSVSAFYFVRMVRRQYALLEERDEVLYETATSLMTPLEKSAALLATLQTNSSAPTTQKDIQELRKDIDVALEEVRHVLARTEEPATLEQHRNLGGAKTCHVCASRIGWLARYWAIPDDYRESRVYGSHRNDIHCVSCHENDGNACGHCALYSTPASAS